MYVHYIRYQKYNYFNSNKRKTMSKRVVYFDLDKQVFLEILKKYKHVIESKGTSFSSLREKSEAWSLIMEEYNNSSLISTKRDVQQLKKYWSNIKQQNKNILTAERQSRFLTGGGPQEAVNEIDPNVLDIVPDLMTTTPTISSSNLSTQESGDRQKEVLKAVRQNSFTKIIDIAKGEHSKNQQKLLTSCNKLTSDNINEKINDIEMEIDDTLSTERWSSNESDIYIVEKENREKDPLNFEKNRRINTKSFPNSKKQKTERMTLICEKEMELADIKINHEIEMCKLKKEREEYINQITIEKLFLEKKELQERVKLAKFRAQKEMGEHYVPGDNEQE